MIHTLSNDAVVKDFKKLNINTEEDTLTADMKHLSLPYIHCRLFYRRLNLKNVKYHTGC